MSFKYQLLDLALKSLVVHHDSFLDFEWKVYIELDEAENFVGKTSFKVETFIEI